MRLLSALLGLSSTLFALPPAQAQAYPNKPVRILVAYSAGQGTDIATRYLAEQISKDIGQPIVIDNRPGAGGNLGTDLAAQAEADGYTLTMGTNATHALNQFLYSKLPFDAEKAFEPIALVGTFPMVVAVNTGSSLTSISDLLAVARKNSREADVALPSTTARLVLELLKSSSGAPLFGVPYKGSGNAMTDVLGGQVPVIVDTPTALKTQLAAGKVRALAVTSGKPSGLAPGVKPVAEQGVAGFEVVAWNALYAPKGTPAPVISFWNAAMNKALARPETRQRLLELGFDPAGGTPAQLSEFAKAERQKWQPIIKAAGITMD
ncbi:MAG: tripartite tricarboxylate transporter substrate binding protein [Hydrogenophaga sp.]|jgi:tripartite-type tricarboxylate transporter receptor subunit TctC|uniref:Bug family tripartite tricarboxylate transporter substrate binding protein n=1 Tax=Hydrogenophaga sp. TaxID=1904254 RepID=UPI0026301E09|nr:tripartite tricarboxylate transporter substrate-binding protein [Hydrogenophaga sp.]MCV0441072.1 tripartite tricarboxylate transporter substrate binding protein [Hydrogenophaga sp.]